MEYPKLVFNRQVPDFTVDYVKRHLDLIGNIKEFEVFYNNSPYKLEGEQYDYTFILRNDNNDEFWLDTLCGYSGAGPNATKKILQILGLKDDYKISEKKYIKETNLKPIHQLNLLITTTTNYINKAHHSWAIINFPYAYQLLNAKNALECFGCLSDAKSEDINIPLSLQNYESAYEWADYATNNEYLLHREYSNVSPSILKTIIKSIVMENYGSVEFKDYA